MNGNAHLQEGMRMTAEVEEELSGDDVIRLDIKLLIAQNHLLMALLDRMTMFERKMFG